MLQKLTEHIAACLERADAAERRAAEASDLNIKKEYQQIGKAWRHLAASYQFSEALERFVLDVERAKRELPRPPTAPE